MVRRAVLLSFVLSCLTVGCSGGSASKTPAKIESNPPPEYKATYSKTKEEAMKQMPEGYPMPGKGR